MGRIPFKITKLVLDLGKKESEDKRIIKNEDESKITKNDLSRNLDMSNDMMINNI